MNRSVKNAFGILILLQGLHSLEEYVGRLWEVFLPAKLLTGLVSADHETGFLIINIGLFVFGIWCLMVPVRKNLSYATTLIGFWLFIEIINGIGHPLWSVYEARYTPGLLTAPALLISTVFLLRELRNQRSSVD